jgi:hypothetical protein
MDGRKASWMMQVQNNDSSTDPSRPLIGRA